MKKNVIGISLACVLVNTSCAVAPTEIQPTKVSEAVTLQYEILKSPLFSEVLRELERENAIDWERRTASVADDLSSYPTYTEWALSKFKKEGPYKKEDIGFWRKWNPWSSTTAATVTCGNSMRLNKWQLNRSVLAIANTLIHERNHSFCLTHPDDQTRTTNKCDFSYVSGDLAESILAFSRGDTQHKLKGPMCPALCKALEARGMPHACNET